MARCVGLTLLVVARSLASGAEPPEPRTALQVTVVPPLDSAGKPWRIHLLEVKDGAQRLARDEPAPYARALRLELAAGRSYFLRLKTSNGDTWFTDGEPFVAGQTAQTRVLDATLERVRGIVLVGSRPLPHARLTFSSELGRESVSLTAKVDGKFVGILPRLGRWHVAVSSESPQLHRELDMEVLHNDHGNELDAEVRLIPHGIEGELVDIENRPIRSRMTISMTAAVPSDHRYKEFDTGAFEIFSMAEGESRVEASAGYRDADGVARPLTTEPRAVLVEGGAADPAWLRFVMRREIDLAGRLVAPSGEGVPRAHVTRLDRFGGMRGASGQFRSDAQGRFVVPFLEGIPAACLAISPPGFATRVARVIYTKDEQAIPVLADGGSLFLDQPYARAKSLDSRTVVLVHAGCVISPRLFRGLQSSRKAQMVDTGMRLQFTIPNLEPGAYSACAVTLRELEAQGGAPTLTGCVDGTLAPNGRLELSILP